MSVQATIVIRKTVKDNDKAKDFFAQVDLALTAPETIFNQMNTDSKPMSLTMNISEHFPLKENSS